MSGSSKRLSSQLQLCLLMILCGISVKASASIRPENNNQVKHDINWLSKINKLEVSCYYPNSSVVKGLIKDDQDQYCKIDNTKQTTENNSNAIWITCCFNSAEVRAAMVFRCIGGSNFTINVTCPTITLPDNCYVIAKGHSSNRSGETVGMTVEYQCNLGSEVSTVTVKDNATCIMNGSIAVWIFSESLLYLNTSAKNYSDERWSRSTIITSTVSTFMIIMAFLIITALIFGFRKCQQQKSKLTIEQKASPNPPPASANARDHIENCFGPAIAATEKHPSAQDICIVLPKSFSKTPPRRDIKRGEQVLDKYSTQLLMHNVTGSIVLSFNTLTGPEPFETCEIVTHEDS